ncbi:MAG: hypothetical protein IPM06_20900 [Rhizobiales bacterium]|nr:hypothetical protein [Hyphomicrobiales bacterium]
MRTIGSAFLIAVTVVTVGFMAAIWDTIPAGVAIAGEFALLSLRTCGAVIIAVIAVVAFWFIARQAHERNRMRDGAWPLREYQLLPLTARIANFVTGRPSPKAVYDHNLNAAPWAVIHDAIYVPPVTAEQFAYAQHQETTNRIRARWPGDATLSLPFVNVGSLGKMSAPEARLAAGAYDRPQKQLTGPVADAPQPKLSPPLSLETALTQTTHKKWILGQNRESGELAIWMPDSTPHIGVIGASGSGKTESSIMHLITAARTGPAATRWHVIILDPIGGADLRPFSAKTEWHDTSADVFPDQLAALSAIMEERKRLCSAAGVPRVADLPDAPRQVMLLIDEFGQLMSRLRGAARESASVVLEDIVRVGRKWGIHLALCDQDKSRWSPTIRDNISPTLTYRMADYGGSRVKAFDADTLSTGQFVMGRRVFDAWHVAPRLGEILSAMPAQSARLIGVRSVTSPNGGEGVSPDTERLPNAERTLILRLNRTPKRCRLTTVRPTCRAQSGSGETPIQPARRPRCAVILPMAESILPVGMLTNCGTSGPVPHPLSTCQPKPVVPLLPHSPPMCACHPATVLAPTSPQR